MASKHQRIKVLFSIPNFDTAGSGKALLKVAMGLNLAKFEPHIMCLHSRGTFFEIVEKSGIPVHIIPFTSVMKPYVKGIWKCYKVSRLLKAINPTIIHSFHYGADYSEALAAKMAGIKWIYSKKNMNWGGASKNGWRLRSKLATAIVAQNTHMLQLFFENSNKVHLIPRGVDTQEFFPQLASMELKKQWNLSENDRIVMCVANLVPVKGIEVLIAAFGKMSLIHTSWKLIIVGDYSTDYGKKLRELVIKMELRDRVIFTGKQQNINNYLSLAELFVLPTMPRGEGSPVALLEAMACEIMVLGSNISGIYDQLEKFSNYLVDSGNKDAWEQALDAVFVRESIENREKGRVFRQHVIDHFSLEKEISRCEQLYESLA